MKPLAISVVVATESRAIAVVRKVVRAAVREGVQKGREQMRAAILGYFQGRRGDECFHSEESALRRACVHCYEEDMAKIRKLRPKTVWRKA